MPEGILVDQCAPTLAGLKTASLFRIPYVDEKTARLEIRELNRIFVTKGLRMVPLRFVDGHMLVYVYRPALLQKDMCDPKACPVLADLGYHCDNPDACVAQLARRLKEQKDFPHEIGFFLGYPPEDVIGFMEHKGNDCKCTGFWKVYGDEEEANRLFALYRKCTHVYRKRLKEGRSIEQLTVRTSVR